LNATAKNWATPRGMDSEMRAGSTETTNWGTPSARDSKDGHSIQNVPENGLLRRQTALFPCSPLDETTSDLGLLLQVWTRPLCPVENARFADFHMGWPPGWSDAMNSLGSQEMASWRFKLRAHLWNFISV
jgi:hypothetical protein